MLAVNSLQLLRSSQVAACGSKASAVTTGGVQARGRQFQGGGVSHLFKSALPLPDPTVVGAPQLFVHEEEIKQASDAASEASISYLGPGTPVSLPSFLAQEIQ